MKIKNTMRNFLFGLIVSFTIMLVYSACDQYVALGAGVDILPPEGSISYPDAGETPIRGSFVIKGTAKDDEGLRSISVSFKNKETGEKIKTVYSAAPFAETGEKTEWTISVNNESAETEKGHPLVKVYPIPDGEYEAFITLTDKQGKKTVLNQTYKIDNTPPVFIVSRPSTIAGKDETLNVTSVDGYGAVFSVVGQVGEKNTVEKLLVQVPEKNIDLTNMFVGKNINVQAAVHTKDNPPALYAQYDQKAVSAQMFLYDNAREFKGSGSSTEGNKAEWYYLRDKIYSEVLQKGYTAEVISDYLSGKDGKGSGDHNKKIRDLRADTEALAILKNAMIDMSEKRTAFKLDSRKSPGFKVVGVKNLSKKDLNLNKASSILFTNEVETSFLVELLRNKDGTPLVHGNTLEDYKKSDIKIELYRWNGNSGKTETESFKSGENLEKLNSPLISFKTLENTDSIIPSGESLRIKCKLPKPFDEGKYLLKVEGTDISGTNDFLAYDDTNEINDGLYIINFLYSGSGPQVRPIREENETYKNSGPVKVEADVTGLDATAKVYYAINQRVDELHPDETKILENKDTANPQRYEADIPLSDLTKEGDNQIFFLAKNGQGNGKHTADLIIKKDTTPPEVKMNFPDPEDPQAGEIAISGNVNDTYAGVNPEKTKWIIGKRSSVPAANLAMAGPDGLQNDGWKDNKWQDMVQTTTGSWNFKYNFDKMVSVADTYGTVKNGSIYTVPVYIRTEDNIGNTKVHTFDILFDKDGKKPIVKVLAPAKDAKLGGTIQLFGIASAPKGGPAAVGGVYIQFSKSGNFAGGADGQFGTSGTPSGYNNDWQSGDGQLIPGSSGGEWRLEINGNGAFNGASEEQAVYYKLRAKNKDNTTWGEWTEVRMITVDKEAPVISEVKIANVSGGSSEQSYQTNMWVGNGKKLTAQLSDPSGLKEVELSSQYLNGGFSYKLSAHNIPSGWLTGISGGYDLNLPVNLDQIPAAANGAFKVKIAITENTENNRRTENEFEFRFDTDNPSGAFGEFLIVNNADFGTSSTSDRNIASEVDNYMQNTGAAYGDLGILIGKTPVHVTGKNGSVVNFTPALTESGSYNYILYKKKTLIHNTGSGNASPWVIHGVADDEGSGVKQVRAKVEVNGTFSKEVVMTETGVDDRISKQLGGQVTWTGKIDLRYDDNQLSPGNLSDGKGKLHYQIIDKGGNTYNVGSAYGGTGAIDVIVKNKPIKVSMVTLKTKVGGVEKTFANSDTNNALTITSDAKRDSTGTFTSSQFAFKDKNYSKIKVDFTGGQEQVKYKLFYNNSVLSGHNLENISSGGEISLTEADLTAIDNSNGTPKNLILELWDEAHGFTQGTDSAFAKITISTLFEAIDKTPPVPAILPFRWNGEDDNSLYQNSRANGHIEIKDDLTDVFNGSTGLMDKDDKVSGKISIRGTAHDDQIIKEIAGQITDFTFNGISGAASGTETKLTEYNAGKFADIGEGTDKYNPNYVASDDSGYTDVMSKRKTFFNAKGWLFTITSSEFDIQNGHTVNWQLDWDSSKITGGVGTDKTIKITVKDASGNPAHTVSKELQVDVVPYITEVKTKLSELSSNASVYNRTALGRYPVSDKEEITIEGFNLGGAAFELNGTALTASGTAYAVGSAASGELIAKVGTIESLNNKTNNTKPYNQEPNNVNNNLLTDDRFIDVWEFKQAAKPANGFISYPVLKVSPKDGSVGLAYANGVTYFNMAGFKDSDGQNEYKSARQFDMNWAQYVHTDFTFDEHGYTYGMATGVDMNTTGNVASYSKFVSRRPGTINQLNNMGNTNGTQNGIGLRIENIGTTSNPYTVDPDRIQSPSITTVAGSASNEETFIYLAYYDTINQHIRYRWGKISKKDSSPFHQYGGQLIDLTGYGTMQEPPATSFSILAGPPAKKYPSDNGGSTQTDGVNNSGKYVSLAAVKASIAGTTHDVVTAVWYNFRERALMYAYTTGDPQTDNVTWSTPVKISSGGEYVRSIADPDGGIHVAFYDSGNLKYAYKPKGNTEAWSVVIVDSYSLTGTHVSIDLARAKTGGKWIPYISYYMQGGASAKLAYLVDETAPTGSGAGSIKAGAGTDEKFTGAWEVSIVPATNVIREYRINVGVWKDGSTGVIKAIPYKANSGSDGAGWVTGGNDTVNPIIGYAVVEEGAFETAQKK